MIQVKNKIDIRGVIVTTKNSDEPRLTLKEEMEEWYKKPDPWKFKGTLMDLVRRKVILHHLEYAFDNFHIRDVLDAGCGEGFLTLDLARAYDVKIDAFDISENAIKYAKQNHPAENINYFSSDIREFQSTKQYDLVLCEEALNHLNDVERKQAIRKFHAILKKDSFLKFSDISMGWYDGFYYFTIEDIRNLFAENGYEIISMYPNELLRNQFLRTILLRIANKLFSITKWKVIVDLLTYITLRSPLKAGKHVSVLAKKA